MSGSFRFKLAARATIVVALGLLALSVIALWALKHVLDGEIDSSILNVASIQAASLADGPSGDMRFHEWDLTPTEAASVRDLIRYAQVWQADGVSLLRNGYMTSDLEYDPQDLARAAGGELVWAEGVFEDAPIRTVYYPLERLGEAHETHILQVAAPLRSRNELLRRTAGFLGLLTALLAVATAAGSWWLAGSAVRPIHEVIDQAEAIGAGSLGRGIQAYADTREYRRLVDVLNTMLGRIQRAFDAQRRFTADASHELRSPLTAMRGEIELALRRDRERADYTKVLESTLEEVDRLSRITEDLLTLARSDAGALRPRTEPLDVGEVARNVVERLASRAQEKEIDLTMATNGPIFAELDPRLLSQIVWNLVDNALNYTPSGGSVRISVSNASGPVTLVVEDTGPGLVRADPEMIFERFTRADEARTHNSEIGGTGLGLAIVKAVVEAHGGKVHAEDRAGGGARFQVRLPTTPPSASPSVD